MKSEVVRTDDDVSLGLHQYGPSSSGPSVLLLHGAFSGHTIWLRGPGVAKLLAAAGFDVWLADLRHHGTADREPAPRTWWFEDWIERDVPAILTRVREHIGRRALGVIGHSAGGVAGLGALARAADVPGAGIDAMVALGTPGPARMGALRYLGARAFRTLALTLGRFPARALRFGGEDEAARMFGQWMAWNVHGRWLSRDGFDYLASLERVRTPYLAVAGGRDWLFSPPPACRQIVERIGSERKDFHIAPALNHSGLVLDTRAAVEVMPRLTGWLRAVLP